MVSENVIGKSELESAWNSTRRDVETKLAIYKLYSDISLHFQDDHINYIVQKICESDPNEIITEEVELVYELSRFSTQELTFTKTAREFFWRIICSVEHLYSKELIDLALSKFCFVMRSWNLREERVDVLYACIENIKNVRLLV